MITFSAVIIIKTMSKTEFMPTSIILYKHKLLTIITYIDCKVFIYLLIGSKFSRKRYFNYIMFDLESWPSLIDSRSKL